jgi:hypothetical protein
MNYMHHPNQYTHAQNAYPNHNLLNPHEHQYDHMMSPTMQGNRQHEEAMREYTLAAQREQTQQSAGQEGEGDPPETPPSSPAEGQY